MKNKIIGLFTFILLVIAAPLTIFVINRDTEMRGKAVGSNQIIICYNGGTDCDFDYQGGANAGAFQQAVEFAQQGDSILVKEGEYIINHYYHAFTYEFETPYPDKPITIRTGIFIDKDLSISGEGVDKTIIHFNSIEPVYELESAFGISIIESDVNLSNIKLLDENWRSFGIALLKDSKAVIDGLYISGEWGPSIIQLDDSETRVSNSEFAENTSGNAIKLNNRSKTVFSDSIVSNNHGIYGWDDTYIEVYNSIFKNGITQYGVRVRDNSKAIIHKNKFTGLSTGIICEVDSKVSIIDNEIIDNDWWAVTTHGTCSAFVSNNIMTGNGCGGVYSESYSYSKIINNIILDNGFIYDFPRCGGIHAGSYADIEAHNNIVSYNKQGISRNTYHERPFQIAYNDVYSNQIADYQGVEPGEGSIGEEALFVDTVNNDFHLGPGSPAIDAGNPDPLYNDLDGSRNDMGIYGGPYSKGQTTNPPPDPVDPPEPPIGGTDLIIRLQVSLANKVKDDGSTNFENDSVRVKLVKGVDKYEFTTTLDSSGYSPELTLEGLSEGVYDVFIKPQYYISRKVSNMTLSIGLNTIQVDEAFNCGDFSLNSYDYLNSLDFSQFIMYLRNKDFTGDCNADGVLNSIDYSIILKTFRTERSGVLVDDPI